MNRANLPGYPFTVVALLLGTACEIGESVQGQIVTGTVTILSLIVAGLVQRFLTNRQTATLVKGQEGIHELVDGTASELRKTATATAKQIVALKDEISRLNQPGAHPTPQAKAGTGAPGQVTQDHSVITTQPEATTGRRAGDPDPATSPPRPATPADGE